MPIPSEISPIKLRNYEDALQHFQNYNDLGRTAAISKTDRVYSQTRAPSELLERNVYTDVLKMDSLHLILNTTRVSILIIKKHEFLAA